MEIDDRLHAAADRLGVVDALLFRRLSAATWAHLGGLGRGRGWAGVVELSVAEEPLLTQLPDAVGSVLRFDRDVPSRVLGPYYALHGALVRVTGDVVVVLANPNADLSDDATDEQLIALGVQVDERIEDVSPSKRLADELEVLHAVQAITTVVADDLPGTLDLIVKVAAASLSCEVGLLRDGSGRLAVTSNLVGLDLGDQRLAWALDALERGAGASSLCIQDTDLNDEHAPLGREQGVRSLLAVGIPAPVGGVLVVAHTSAGPRGFTGLCQQLGRQIAEATGLVAHTAAMRDELRAAAAQQALTARRDPLTALGNRLAFDEALVQAQARVDAGGDISVITLDVDGLKHVNDTDGHAAGDDLLRRCGAIVLEVAGDDGVAVRLGGDEFALVLPTTGPMAAERFERLRAALQGAHSCARVVAASVGMGAAGPGGSVADAVRQADGAMYEAKRARRAHVPAQMRPETRAAARHD